MSQFETVLQPIPALCARPLPYTDSHKCEFVLNIGIFFDGTDNNANGTSSETHTNVARLWRAYRDDPESGSFSHYVSGIGTPFTEIKEKSAPPLAGAIGAGGEERIVYGLLRVINSVHRFFNKEDRYGDAETAALCSSTSLPGDDRPAEVAHVALRKLGLSRGLVGDSKGRDKFIRAEAAKLTQQLTARETRPVVKSIYIDVFGFSRGAAQARVFVTWLHRLMLIQGKLFGADAYVRMLGLFDTVSSVGVTDAFGGSGHSGWALAGDLPIHEDVKKCVHFVALHELRSNFPSDSIAVGADGVIPHPDRFFERFYPGSHSDVGGGYAPGDQGKGVALVYDALRGTRDYKRDDTAKLSQLALNDMHAAALASCREHEDQPWIDLESKSAIDVKLPDLFAMKTNERGVPFVRQAVADYFANCGVKDGLTAREGLREHGLRYLAWRYVLNDEKNGFHQLPSVARAITLDASGLVHYRRGQSIFEQQIMLLTTRPGWGDDSNGKNEARNAFSPHAHEILQQMQRTPTPIPVRGFFDQWVHDSYAGFIGKFSAPGANWVRLQLGNVEHIVAEAQRYVRWRGLYCGGDTQLNARTNDSGDQRRAAA